MTKSLMLPPKKKKALLRRFSPRFPEVAETRSPNRTSDIFHGLWKPYHPVPFRAEDLPKAKGARKAVALTESDGMKGTLRFHEDKDPRAN